MIFFYRNYSVGGGGSDSSYWYSILITPTHPPHNTRVESRRRRFYYNNYRCVFCSAEFSRDDVNKIFGFPLPPTLFGYNIIYMVYNTYISPLNTNSFTISRTHRRVGKRVRAHPAHYVCVWGRGVFCSRLNHEGRVVYTICIVMFEKRGLEKERKIKIKKH